MSDIKQVIVMRTDLNMRKGKMIAQGAHAAMMFMTKRLEAISTQTFELALTEEEVAWVKGNFKKITVQAKTESQLDEIYEAAKAAGLEVNLCVDSGLTEFKGVPTKTCLAIGPANAAEIDAITGNLPLL